MNQPIVNPVTRAAVSTGYARLGPWPARAVLVAWFLLAVFCLMKMPAPPPGDDRPMPPGQGDVALYRAEVERIHAGEDYYQVAAQELAARGYPTAQRVQLADAAADVADRQAARAGAGQGASGPAGLGAAAGRPSRPPPAEESRTSIAARCRWPCCWLGPLLPCVLGDLFVLPVLWSGVLIALSVCAYGLDRPRLGVAAGVAAVFFRELALPYCLLGAPLAAWQRRRGELAFWLAGLAAWASVFGLHWLRVANAAPDAAAHREGWIQFGGLAFVEATMQMNACLLLLPQWVTALYFAAALLGLAGWHSPLGLRIGPDRLPVRRGLLHRGPRLQPLLGPHGLAPLVLWGSTFPRLNDGPMESG